MQLYGTDLTKLRERVTRRLYVQDEPSIPDHIWAVIELENERLQRKTLEDFRETVNES